MSVKLKIFLVFIGFVFLLGSSIGITMWTVNSQKSDGIIINLAGKQRMLTQQITKDTLAISLGVESARESLAKTADLFDRTLNALINGGVVPASGGDITLPPTRDNNILVQMNKVKGLWDELHKNVKVMLNKDSDLPSVVAAAKFIEGSNMTLLNEMNEAVDMYAAATTKKTRTLLIVEIIFFLTTLAMAGIGWFILIRFVVIPIDRVVEFAQSIAIGELTVSNIEVTSRDEMGNLGNALNGMKERLGNIIGNMGKAAQNIATTAGELASSSSQIAQGAERQSTHTDQVAAAMHEMNATVSDISRNSQTAAGSAKEASNLAVSGMEVFSKGIERMTAISETVQRSTQTMEALGKRSDEIGTIAAVIDDIADQTNLLALNAAIEAARAGEQGRGFAVVADEVRKLAEKTTKATKEITEMIKAIQNDTRGAIASIQHGTKQVDEGVRYANDADTALKRIVSSVETVTMLVGQIATAAEEQSASSGDISRNITGIATVAKETAKGVKEMSVSTGNLKDVADELRAIIGSYTVKKKAHA